MATRLAAQAVVLALALAVPAHAAAATGLSGCDTRTMRVTFYTCEESSAHCLTRNGHQPIPFRTVAVGDRALLGRWLYIEDLGGWVLASDTGGALKVDSLDVFIGESRMAKHAKRLGVQFWDVRVCESARRPRPVEAALRGPALSADAGLAPGAR